MATQKFREHESSQVHKESIEKLSEVPPSKDVGNLLLNQNIEEKEKKPTLSVENYRSSEISFAAVDGLEKR